MSDTEIPPPLPWSGPLSTSQAAWVFASLTTTVAAGLLPHHHSHSPSRCTHAQLPPDHKTKTQTHRHAQSLTREQRPLPAAHSLASSGDHRRAAQIKSLDAPPASQSSPPSPELGPFSPSLSPSIPGESSAPPGLEALRPPCCACPQSPWQGQPPRRRAW